MNVLAFKQDFEGIREEFQGCHQGDNVAMALKTGEQLGSVEIQQMEGTSEGWNTGRGF